MSRFPFLIFDWDGTIADSAALIVQAIQAACRDMNYVEPSVAKARYVIGLGLSEALQHIAPDLEPLEQQRFADAYKAHYLGRDSEVALFAGMYDLLCELKNAGFQLAVATGKSRAGLNRALEQTRLQDFFLATRCADEGFSKPHPGMLQHLFEVTGFEAKQALMIGDTTHDMQLAKNAGAEKLAVAYGAHDRQDLLSLEPLSVLGSVDELAAWLRTHA